MSSANTSSGKVGKISQEFKKSGAANIILKRSQGSSAVILFLANKV